MSSVPTTPPQKQSRYSNIPSWARVTLGVGATFLLGAFVWDTSSGSPWLKGVRALFMSAGFGLIVSTLTAIANVLIENIWPNPEERRSCADIWINKRRDKIRAALNSSDPAEALKIIYAGDREVALFNSSNIFQAIRSMHEGAFLAAIHLWGEDTYDEKIMPAEFEVGNSTLQSRVYRYRELVAKNIKLSHNIAARRYRVRASDYKSFVGSKDGPKWSFRLKSLAELAYNVAYDLNKGWSVDVEFYSKSERHNPYLDYALLFGARPSEFADSWADMPRVAYITHSRHRLLSDEDYTGIVVSDPELIMFIMEERFRTDMDIQNGHEFIKIVTPFLREECNNFVTSPDNDPSPEYAESTGNIETIKLLLAGFEKGLLRRVADVTVETSTTNIEIATQTTLVHTHPNIDNSSVDGSLESSSSERVAAEGVHSDPDGSPKERGDV